MTKGNGRAMDSLQEIIKSIRGTMLDTFEVEKMKGRTEEENKKLENDFLTLNCVVAEMCISTIFDLTKNSKLINELAGRAIQSAKSTAAKNSNF